MDLLTELSKLSPLPFICETPYFALKLTDFLRNQKSYASLNSEYLMCYTFEHKYYYARHFLIHSLKSYNYMGYKEPEVRERK